MDIPGYVDAVRSEGRALLDAAAAAGLDAPVPSCAGWLVRDLVRHVGGVHHWAGRQLGERRTDEISGDLEDIVGGWPPDDELLGWGAAQLARLVEELERADPDYPYFTWFRGDTPLTMWSRRQAHETAVHRVDADLAAGRRSDFAAGFAADGVDELVLDMVGEWERALPVDSARTLHVAATDIDRSWTLSIGPGGLGASTGRHGRPDAVATATASALYQALWGRGDDAVAVEGDRGVLAVWLAHVTPRWS